MPGRGSLGDTLSLAASNGQWASNELAVEPLTTPPLLPTSSTPSLAAGSPAYTRGYPLPYLQVSAIIPCCCNVGRWASFP